MKRSSLRSRSGFTLLEILLVLSVLGIILAVSTPALSTYLRRVRFEQDVRTVNEALVLARDTASSSGTFVRVQATGSKISWYDDVDDAKLGERPLANGTAFVGTNNVIITGRGLPVQQTKFELSRGALSRNVFLLPTGAIVR